LLAATDEVDPSALGAWQRIVQLAIDEKASAVAIAGDIFDSAASGYQQEAGFLAQVHRLREAKIPLVVVAGNHDWDSLPRVASRNEGIIFLGANGWEQRAVHTNDGDLRFVGWSFPNSHMRDSPLDQWDDLSLDGDLPTVGLLHCDDAQNSRYAPTRQPDLVAKGLDAWLLGHIHVPRDLGENIRYPGSPQALDFGEMGPRGVMWLAWDGGEARFSELVQISSVLYVREHFTFEPGALTDPKRVRDVIESSVYTRASQLAQDVIGSVQMRVAASFKGENRKLDRIEACLLSDTPHAWEATSVQGQNSGEPRDYVAQEDLGGQISRLLLGLEDDCPDEDWKRQAEAMVEKCSGRASEIYKLTVEKALSDQVEHAKPDEEEHRRVARELVQGRLQSLLSEWEKSQKVNA
jgi:DNA repair protein SbcD/Mre11